MSKEPTDFWNRLDPPQCQWPEEKGDKCWECWKLEPCCGKPCNFLDGLYCLVLHVVRLCEVVGQIARTGMQPKHQLFETMDIQEKCAIVNHCLPWGVAILCFILGEFFFPFTWVGSFIIQYLRTCMRLNIRRDIRNGDSVCTIGDWVCSMCWCGCCQECRAVEKEDWDWFHAIRNDGVICYDAEASFSFEQTKETCGC